MNSRSLLTSLVTGLAALLVNACGSSEPSNPFERSLPDGGLPTIGIAALSSDYQLSSSVSLLDRTGNLVSDGCFHSGSGGVGLASTLSGDVVFPSQLPGNGTVLLIDRMNSALTWLSPSSCAPERQLSVATGFASNPHDVVVLSESRAYVTRWGKNGNPTPAPEDLDDGDDLLIIDASRSALVGRIDLSAFAPAGTLAHPDRAILAAGRIFVSLNAISADFSTYGQGRVVAIDPASDQVVAAIDLPGAKNCGAMTYLQASQKLLVVCSGDYSDAEQAASSAIIAIDVASAAPAVVAQVPASSIGGTPFSNGALAALDESRIMVVGLGSFSAPPPDRLWSVGLGALPPVPLFESAESFSLGTVLADPTSGRVLVADSPMIGASLVRVFDDVAGAFVAGAAVPANPSQKLPVRALAFY